MDGQDGIERDWAEENEFRMLANPEHVTCLLWAPILSVI